VSGAGRLVAPFRYGGGGSGGGGGAGFTLANHLADAAFTAGDPGRGSGQVVLNWG
jgi:hypothetical protein